MRQSTNRVSQSVGSRAIAGHENKKKNVYKYSCKTKRGLAKRSLGTTGLANCDCKLAKTAVPRLAT